MSIHERAAAYRNTRLVAGLVFAIAVAAVPLGVMTYGWWPQGCGDALHALLALAVGLVVHRSHARWSAHAYDALYVLLALPYLATTWWPQLVEARAGTLSEPLLTSHFIMLGLAILPPRSLRVALSLIGLFTLHALVMWDAMARIAGAAALPREPWLTLFFAGITGGVCWSRWKRQELELRFALIATRADALARFNRILLGLRDRANTPLQTLEIGMTLLAERGADPARQARVIALMRGAVSQLSAFRLPGTQAVLAPDANGLASLSIDLERELAEVQALGAPSIPVGRARSPRRSP